MDNFESDVQYGLQNGELQNERRSVLINCFAVRHAFYFYSMTCKRAAGAPSQPMEYSIYNVTKTGTQPNFICSCTSRDKQKGLGRGDHGTKEHRHFKYFF